MTDYCTHPPFVISYDGHIEPRQLEYIARQLAGYDTTSRKPIAIEGDALVVPIECSWCRAPTPRGKAGWPSPTLILLWIAAFVLSFAIGAHCYGA